MANTPKRSSTETQETAGPQSPGLGGSFRREMLAVLIVLLAAAIIRVIYLLQYKAHVPYYTAYGLDSTYYDEWAWRVMQGRGYGPMPFYMAPLYPYVLAGIYLIAGHSLTLVYALQSVLGLVNLLLTYFIGRRLFGHRSGLIAMVLMTAYAPLVYLESKLLTETLALALNLASILLLMTAMRRPTLMRFLSAGVVLGLSAVCRPSALVTILLILAWMALSAIQKRGLSPRHVYALVFGVMLAILPVTARNYVIGHDAALITTNGGIVFAQANNPSANGISSAMAGFTGSVLTQQEEEMLIARKALGHPVNPSESSSFWLGSALQFIRRQPLEFAELLGRKAVWSLHNTEADCSYNVYLEMTLVPILRLLALPFSILAGLALFGLTLGKRASDRQGFTLLGIYLASVFLGLIVFSVTSRYRVPAIPALCIFAGYGLVRAVELRQRGMIAVAASVALFILISMVPYPLPRITAASLANLGSSYVAVGQQDLGIVELRKSLMLDPNQAAVYSSLGAALTLDDNADEAIKCYTRSLEIAPDQPGVRNALGFALLWTGDATGAEREFREAISLKPDFAEAHVGLANALQKQNRLDEAGKERAIANRIQPDLAQEYLNVGNTLVAQGNLDEAIRQYQEAIHLNPEFADAYVNLGLALKDQKKYTEAIRQYREAIRIQPDLVRAHNNLAIAMYLQGRYAEAWKAVHASQAHGGNPHPGFVQALTGKMPDPGR